MKKVNVLDLGCWEVGGSSEMKLHFLVKSFKKQISDINSKI